MELSRFRKEDYNILKVSYAGKLVLEQQLGMVRICHLSDWRKGRGNYRCKGPEVEDVRCWKGVRKRESELSQEGNRE